jgi:hypothetical protein
MPVEGDDLSLPASASCICNPKDAVLPELRYFTTGLRGVGCSASDKKSFKPLEPIVG